MKAFTIIGIFDIGMYYAGKQERGLITNEGWLPIVEDESVKQWIP